MSLNQEAAGDLMAARTAFSAGQIPQAIAICEDLVAADRTNYDAWEVLGAARARSGQLQPGAEAMRQCVRLRPNLARPHFNLANALVALGDRDGAREELELCLSLDPSYTRASQALRELSGVAGHNQASALPGEMSGLPQSGGPGLGTSPSAGMEMGTPSFNEPMIGQAPPSIGQAPPPTASATIGSAPPAFIPSSEPPPFVPGGPAPAATTAAGTKDAGPAGSRNSYGLYVQHELDDTVAHWLKRAAWMGGALTFLSLGSLFGSHDAQEGNNTIQMILALFQILVGAGLMTGAIAVLNRKDWGRKLVQCCAIPGFFLAGTALALMLSAGNLDYSPGPTAVLATRSPIRPILWMFCCGFLFWQMNTEYVKLAMDPAT